MSDTPSQCQLRAHLVVALRDTVWPSISILPVSGVSAPDKHLIKVDLPAPLSPITASTSPGNNSKSAPSNATTLTKSFYNIFSL